MNESLALAAVLVPLACALAAWFLSGRATERFVAAGFAVMTVASLWLAAEAVTNGTGMATAFDGTVVVDALGAGLLVLVLAVGGLALAASPRYLRHELAEGALRPRDEGRYYALLLAFLASLVTIPLMANLGLMWVAVEATTAVAALLVGITRTAEAIEAAWKYLVLGTIGVGFALLATMLAYASSVHVLGETSDALNWTRLLAIAPRLDPGLMRLAFVFALAGYGTKAGLAPFHTWLPDAHSQAPSPVSAVLSGASLAAALYALARFQAVTMGTLGPGFSSGLLVAMGLISIAVALPFLVAQEDLKRLLAYSSIEHMGLLTLGLGFGGPLALAGVALHALLHGLVKATLFLAAGELVQQYGTRRLARIRAASRHAPLAGGALAVGLVLLGGFPPSGIFVTEFMILFGGVGQGFALAAGLAAMMTALAFVALAFHGVRVVWGRPVPGLGIGRQGRVAAAWLGMPLVAVAILGVWTPGPVADMLSAIRAILGGAGV
jgi:hydrogenase-4 component F